MEEIKRVVARKKPNGKSLGERMKEYERVQGTYLTKGVPVIIRLDGKAFHTFTRGLIKPFDDILIETMQTVTRWLVQNVQGCRLGYTQSDEISLLLIDYEKIETEAWFDYKTQKVISLSASQATRIFNKTFREIVERETASGMISDSYREVLLRKLDMAEFDSRAFNVPQHDTNNYFIWRQQDAIRNSIQSVGQYYFSERELFKVNTTGIKEILRTQKGVEFDNIELYKQRGTLITKLSGQEMNMDLKMPLLVENRTCVEDIVYLRHILEF